MVNVLILPATSSVDIKQSSLRGLSTGCVCKLNGCLLNAKLDYDNDDGVHLFDVDYYLKFYLLRFIKYGDDVQKVLDFAA